jgi:proteic killer suppression protein
MCNVLGHRLHSLMIESFRHKGLKRLYEKDDRRGIGANMVARVEEILTILEAAETVEEVHIPGYRLHPLTGNLKGFWSVRVTETGGLFSASRMERRRTGT